MYGVMNGLMVIPIGVSFCAIIFNNTHFQAFSYRLVVNFYRRSIFMNMIYKRQIYMPKLVKLVLFSSVVHQLCFSKFSSLPFAIGQVKLYTLTLLYANSSSIRV